MSSGTYNIVIHRVIDVHRENGDGSCSKKGYNGILLRFVVVE